LKHAIQKLASEIATKTKEKRTLESELDEYTNQLLINEAKIEILEENKGSLHEILSLKKKEKSNLFDKREELITEKRMLQQEFHSEMSSNERKDILTNKISELSENIGEVIEHSKKLSEEMQTIYDETQTEQEKIFRATQDLYQMKREAEETILSYKKKIADADSELSILRRKVSDIQNKL
jgi:chromosome segregation ATPase